MQFGSIEKGKSLAGILAVEPVVIHILLPIKVYVFVSLTSGMKPRIVSYGWPPKTIEFNV